MLLLRQYLSLVAFALPSLASVQILLPVGVQWQFPSQASANQWNDAWEPIQFGMSGEHDIPAQWTLKIPGIGKPECHLTGTQTGDSTAMITFVISPEPSYLHPCGPQNGITVKCEGPAATCL